MRHIYCKTSAMLLAALLFSYVSFGNVHAESGGKAKMIDVKVLSIKGCQATPPTIERIESVAKEMIVNALAEAMEK